MGVFGPLGEFDRSQRNWDRWGEGENGSNYD